MLGRLRRLVRPAARALAAPLARLGVSPLAVTLAAIPLSAGAAIAIDRGRWTVAFLLALAAALTDLVDGALAERLARTSPSGNYLDAMVDKIVEVLLFVGAARHCPVAACAACGTALIVSYAKARVGLVVIGDNRDWPSPGDRADRMVVFLSALFAENLGRRALQPALWVLVAMNLVGVIGRVRHALRLIEEGQRGDGLLPYLRPK
jgi:CDP-diacylglycerol--glycerol-3-phosphate 3-phosphatidyltransferase